VTPSPRGVACLGLLTRLRIFRRRCAKPGLRPGSLSGYRSAVRPLGIMAVMVVAPAEVAEVHVMVMVAISKASVVVMIVMSRTRLGISAESDKREQSYYYSSHQFA
jgi:hypothetical protein